MHSWGGPGNDIALGGDQDDTINGQTGSDTVAGNAGTDTIKDSASEVDESFTWWAEWVDVM
jgi:Ca2+-binding RTX toxin-like protein|tara:strand:- start:582 stop:764 length:183 start_codon:yes stop_codon:yes gene_type:complete